MKRIYSTFILSFIFALEIYKSFLALASSINFQKRFRKADAVFVGQIYDYDDEDIPKIQNYKKGLPVLFVKKSWKGVKKEFIAIDFADFPKSVGTCPILYNFEEGKDYLIFAYGKELKVEVQCSDTRALRAEYDYTTKKSVI